MAEIHQQTSARNIDHHTRDYVIGTSASEYKATLITYDLDDFKWVTEEGGTVHSPESFLATEIK